MNNRFNDLRPKKVNMFRKKPSMNTSPKLQENNRWRKLDTPQQDNLPDNNFNNKSSRFNKPPPEKTNSRWDNLKSDDYSNAFTSKNNSFKKDRFQREDRDFRGGDRREGGRDFRGRRRGGRDFRGNRRNQGGSGIFTNVKRVDGVPQVKGGISKSFNIMDTIQINSKSKKNKSPKNKSPKNKQTKNNIEEMEKIEAETEEEKRQRELWKQQLLEKYAYESDSDEDDEEDDEF